jgi:NTP pyrophosphatase (non-canonical NTP hydrolase)
MAFNGLSAAQAERLSYLAEECAEVIKAVMKIQRHGFSSYNPDAPQDGINRQQLEGEMRDVLGAIARCVLSGDVSATVFEGIDPRKGQRYMHHQDGELMQRLMFTPTFKLHEQ